MNTKKEVSLAELLEACAVPAYAPGSGSALDAQEGGDHYKKMGAYQPWEVAFAQLTPEELKGAMKITVMSYLAREADKGGMGDIRKAAHTLQIYLELEARRTAAQQPVADECCCAASHCGECDRAEAAPKTQENTPMRFGPGSGAVLPFGPVYAEGYRASNGPVAWIYNPWTGQPRDPRDIGTDVLGHLITPQ